MFECLQPLYLWLDRNAFTLIIVHVYVMSSYGKFGLDTFHRTQFHHVYSLSDSATSNKEQCYAEQIIVANFEILLFAGF